MVIQLVLVEVLLNWIEKTLKKLEDVEEEM